MLWGTSGHCQVGKVWGCSLEVLSVVLEGLWTQVQSTCSIHSHTTVCLFLSCPKQRLIRAGIGTIRSALSTETRRKAKL